MTALYPEIDFINDKEQKPKVREENNIKLNSVGPRANQSLLLFKLKDSQNLQVHVNHPFKALIPAKEEARFVKLR